MNIVISVDGHKFETNDSKAAAKFLHAFAKGGYTPKGDDEGGSKKHRQARVKIAKITEEEKIKVIDLVVHHKANSREVAKAMGWKNTRAYSTLYNLRKVGLLPKLEPKLSPQEALA